MSSDFCNINDENAKSDACRTWCQNNQITCWRLKLLNDCTKYKLLGVDCTKDNVKNLQDECVNYGIIQVDGEYLTSDRGVSEYPCNPNSLNKLKSDCNDLGVPNDECNPYKLDQMKTTKLYAGLSEDIENKKALRAEQAQKWGDDKFNTTRALFAKTMSLSQKTSDKYQIEKKKQDEKEGEMFKIISIVCCIIVILIISFLGVLFVIK